jgi:primosomal protein N' (replication factor Y)
MRAASFADVAVPLPILQLFTYSLPAEFREQVHPGMRVIAPFGRRRLTGIVVRTHDEMREDAKPVSLVLDADPLIGPKLLELGLWISSYYLAPPGEAFRMMLPPGLFAKSIATDSLKPWPARRQLAVVELLPTAAQVREETLTPKQREVLGILMVADLPLLLADGARRGADSATVRRLERKGLVRLDEIEIERSPWSSAHVQQGEVQKHPLSEDQRRVYEKIDRAAAAGRFRSLLVHGVTGSGKTEVYLNAIDSALARGKSALLLVPEIGLTPQVARYFNAWFEGRAAILHSGLSDGERFDQWRRIRQGEARVVIGTRSAVFAPLRDLALIIVDEEHDSSYKQEETPRYHGRDTALKRGQLEDAVVVLGSATPQLETYYLAVRRRQHELESLTSRVQQRPLPVVRLVDMRVEFQNRGKAAVISQALEDAIRECLARGQQALVLLNRRGYSPLLLCRSCGYTETCDQCSVSLTFHQETNRLCCHYCGYTRGIPKTCRNCGKEYIYFLGEGTERIEEILREMFPQGRVSRLDRDTAQRRGGITKALGDFGAGLIDILVGTQMIAKGHDFPGVTLVGVLAAEQSLRLADFRAAERTFQLLTQVAGRAGRGDQPGEVIIQTYFPNHYSVKYACAQDYERFFHEEAQFRYRFRYPPFTALANILVSGKDREKVEKRALEVSRMLIAQRNALSEEQRMRFLGPAPAARERLRGEFRFQILIKTTSRAELHQVLEAGFGALADSRGQTRGITVDVDPISLL